MKKQKLNVDIIENISFNATEFIKLELTDKHIIIEKNSIVWNDIFETINNKLKEHV